MQNRDSTTLFTNKAESYSKFRPSYPNSYLDYLTETCRLDASSTVADVGAGTGILTGQLLSRGLAVIAVEPNGDMRKAAHARLGDVPKLKLLSGTAEHTGIGADSVDAVTAAQAFHWFDPDAFLQECRRILKPGGMISLVWNNRAPDSAVSRECHEICTKYSPSFRGFSGGESQQNATTAFFPHGCDIQTFQNDLTYSREAFIGRYLSTSYAPKPQDTAYLSYTRELGALFDRCNSGGLLSIPNVTISYTGHI